MSILPGASQELTFVRLQVALKRPGEPPALHNCCVSHGGTRPLTRAPAHLLQVGLQDAHPGPWPRRHQLHPHVETRRKCRLLQVSTTFWFSQAISCFNWRCRAVLPSTLQCFLRTAAITRTSTCKADATHKPAQSASSLTPPEPPSPSMGLVYLHMSSLRKGSELSLCGGGTFSHL